MKILIIGSSVNLQECQDKFGNQHQYELVSDLSKGENHLSNSDLVFDFSRERPREQLMMYNEHPTMCVFLNTTLSTLKELHIDTNLSANIYGFCGLPTFLNRPILECSVHPASDKHKLSEVCKQLNTEFLVVENRVGLVTPRVICMIINEAYYTVEEGTATREDIDLAMKLGTNYPYGPFEWAQKIGIRNVYEVLKAVYEDTKDERYAICPLLKQECF